MSVTPYLRSSPQSQDFIDVFYGLCRRPNARGDQFRDMRNMTSDMFPYAACRKERALTRKIPRGSALLGGDRLCWAADGALFYDGRAVCALSAGEKRLIRMGAYIVALPDKILYNTHTGEKTDMDQENVVTDGVRARPCMLSGQEYGYTAAPAAPENPASGDYWHNTESGGFYQYLGGRWQGLDTVYTRLEGANIGRGIKEYDVVTLRGFVCEELNGEGVTVYARGDNYLVIATGTIRDYTETARVTVSRRAPEMDFAIESNNRLWACSNQTHEIFASKLGDATNWQSYLGISTDSYAATVGSEGAFTGAFTYLGYPTFFKENAVIRVYGTQPANFTFSELPARGVRSGAERSLCVAGERLYYLSRDGMTAFDGSAARRVDEALFDLRMTGAVCGSHNGKLYAGVETQERGGLYVYDTEKDLWHYEDETLPLAFAGTPEGDYMLTKDALYLLDGGKSRYESADARAEGELDWMCETGEMGVEQPNHLWIKRVLIRLELRRGARVCVDVACDGGAWERRAVIETEGKKTVSIPARLTRCERFALRVSGRGRAVISGISRVYEKGSERARGR